MKPTFNMKLVYCIVWFQLGLEKKSHSEAVR